MARKSIKTIKVSGGSLPSDFSAHIPTAIDYTGANDTQIGAWTDATVVIRITAQWKKLTPEVLKQMERAGIVEPVDILAINAGKKFESRDTQIERRTSAFKGNRELAVLATDNPDAYMDLMAEVKVKPKTEGE